MSATGVLATVRSWFGDVGRASLCLPDGNGGPGRNDARRLSRADAIGDQLLLELDDNLVLVLTTPGPPIVDRDRLAIDRFRFLLLDWRSEGSIAPHTEVWYEGSVRFAGPRAVTAARGAVTPGRGPTA
jgi:hypothetical protein